MKAVLFIEYPKCSTCKNSKRWLKENNVSYEERNIVENTPTPDELTAWIKMSGIDIKRFFNSSGLKYKELGLKDRLPTMSDSEKIQLLSTDGMLIKRPLVIGDDFVLIGFKENDWKERL